MKTLASLALIAAMAVGCVTAQPPTAPRVTAQPVPAQIDIFDMGTWEKSLSATDCGDFLTKMTGAEQFHLSRLLLYEQRMGTVASAPLPTTAMITKFQQGIANLCGGQGGDYPLIAAVVVVYLDDKSFEPSYR